MPGRKYISCRFKDIKFLSAQKWIFLVLLYISLISLHKPRDKLWKVDGSFPVIMKSQLIEEIGMPTEMNKIYCNGLKYRMQEISISQGTHKQIMNAQNLPEIWTFLDFLADSGLTRGTAGSWEVENRTSACQAQFRSLDHLFFLKWLNHCSALEITGHLLR